MRVAPAGKQRVRFWGKYYLNPYRWRWLKFERENFGSPFFAVHSPTGEQRSVARTGRQRVGFGGKCNINPYRWHWLKFVDNKIKGIPTDTWKRVCRYFCLWGLFTLIVGGVVGIIMLVCAQMGRWPDCVFIKFVLVCRFLCAQKVTKEAFKRRLDASS